MSYGFGQPIGSQPATLTPSQTTQLLYDQVLNLATNTMQNLTITTSAQSFQSIEMLVFAPNAGTLHLNFFAVNWRNNATDPASMGAAQFYSEVLTQMNGAGENSWFSLPVLGPTMILRIESSTNETCHVRILGTNRPIPMAKVGFNTVGNIGNSMSIPNGGEVQNVNVYSTSGVPLAGGPIPVSLAANQSVNLTEWAGNALSTSAPVPVAIPAATVATLSFQFGSASSIQLLPANASRKGMRLINDGPAVMWIALDGSTASTLNYSVKLQPGDQYEMPFPPVTTKITGIWASAAGVAYITELT